VGDNERYAMASRRETERKTGTLAAIPSEEPATNIIFPINL